MKSPTLILLSALILTPDDALSAQPHSSSVPCRLGFDLSGWPQSAEEVSLIDKRRKESFEPLLLNILGGKSVPDADIDKSPTWDESTLWLLLNSAYARHGRPFKDPLLHGFFYKHRRTSAVLPLKERAEYRDNELTPADKQNISQIRAQLKRQCGY